jgi:hypothetical protein
MKCSVAGTFDKSTFLLYMLDLDFLYFPIKIPSGEGESLSFFLPLETFLFYAFKFSCDIPNL